MKNIIIVAALMTIGIGCSSQKTTQVPATNTEERRPQRGERPAPPSIEEIFKMDANNDGKLSLEEVSGPLQRDFAKIDADSNGFISRTELENAPKPQRGQRPTKNN